MSRLNIEFNSIHTKWRILCKQTEVSLLKIKLNPLQTKWRESFEHIIQSFLIGLDSFHLFSHPVFWLAQPAPRRRRKKSRASMILFHWSFGLFVYFKWTFATAGQHLCQSTSRAKMDWDKTDYVPFRCKQRTVIHLGWPFFKCHFAKT